MEILFRLKRNGKWKDNKQTNYANAGVLTEQTNVQLHLFNRGSQAP